MKAPDSLMMFVDSAQHFLANELRLPVGNEIVKYMIINHFDLFSSAYSRFRANRDEASRRNLADVIKQVEAQFNLAKTRAVEAAHSVPH